MAPTIASEVARYLRTGLPSDDLAAAWPGTLSERGRLAHRDLRSALVAEVWRRAEGRQHHPVPPGDTVALTRSKVEPMVRGLFPRAEQEVVLASLEKSVVFLTAETFEGLLLDNSWDHSAWNLANLYLLSIGAKLLGKEALRIVGLSEHLTCYVSADYFRKDDAPFADFIVHEAAHIFHNCKRETLGLKATRTREWLLQLEFRKRETFAYACEAYSRVLELAGSHTERRALAAEFAANPRISEENVDPAEVGALVQQAAAARNGWKVILAHCAAAKPKSQAQFFREQEQAWKVARLGAATGS